MGLAMAFDAADLRPSLSGMVDVPGGPPADGRMADAASLYVTPNHHGWLDALLAIAWPHDLVPATLAFLVRSDKGPAYTVWLALFARPDAKTPQFLLSQTWTLPINARQDSFERLLTRCASLPPAARAQLRQQAEQIVRADDRLDAVELWHCLLLDHLLAPRRNSLLRESDHLSLATCAGAIAGVTDVLAAQRYASRADLPERRAALRVALGESLVLPACTDAPTLESWSAVTHAVEQLARLSWMVRPRLMKAGCVLTLDDESLVPLAVADALRTLCILIDTPMPPALQGRYLPHSAVQSASHTVQPLP